MGLKILDIGCGKNKVEGSIGIDLVNNEDVDIVYNLEKCPYPFKDNTFDVVHANHILEHIQLNDHFFNLMKEIHRILKPNGIFKIRVPYWRGKSANCNPEHTRYFSIWSFEYFDIDTKGVRNQLNNRSGIRFKMKKANFNLITDGWLKFLNFLNPVFNLNKELTEKFLSKFIDIEELYFELEAVKNKKDKN